MKMAIDRALPNTSLWLLTNIPIPAYQLSNNQSIGLMNNPSPHSIFQIQLAACTLGPLPCV